MNVTISNITTVYSNGRPVGVATLKSEDGSIVNGNARIADQLLFAKAKNLTITNLLEVLSVLVLTLGFAS
jgi:hypothetical protein